MDSRSAIFGLGPGVRLRAVEARAGGPAPRDDEGAHDPAAKRLLAASPRAGGFASRSLVSRDGDDLGRGEATPRACGLSLF